MATSYAGAVRNGSMAGSRLHMELGTQENMRQHGGGVDSHFRRSRREEKLPDACLNMIGHSAQVPTGFGGRIGAQSERN